MPSTELLSGAKRHRGRFARFCTGWNLCRNPLRWLLACAILFFSSAFLSVASAAESMHFTLEQPALVEENGILWLSVPLSVDDEDKLRDLLRDGATLELDIETKLERHRSLWFNETVNERRFTSHIKYEPILRQYSQTSVFDGLPLQRDNVRKLLAASWKQLKLPILTVSRLDPGEEYQVKVTLQLRYVELPAWLDRSLVLWSRDVAEPETLTLPYRVAHAADPAR